ncbi:UDP-N-acetylmuramate-L-alanyl-gamma-D-glutamyl-meso-2,6-diaminoheptandioate ligase [Candidatus Phycosocius bacilliformis]|uniref:UDP-N-acetylmuramate-L-alanyl-gamma-D-glutamyl-meso-2,6-diaminoheptandioate ligase n=1 Tax=Candidatus Phycosocius bacilliformis TaxID=1445552 RepID=A0A2P2E7F9_9PROT|nr:Mur ligase domain-containing protein [Candidatus Phycosocius bacilliformis]GBF56980.1 UDP-N-acetylmuramate-L-alanyl-gamma-D-glutamyl-meso-2,6-diaminoheptandioate ligase [Candidatus Phycosocius bacilliformis]
MNIYFLGIGGAGVSALASVLQSQGHQVTGSDEGVFPPVSTYLDQAGISYARRFDAANLPDQIDVAVVGTTAKMDPATNPELAALKARGVPCYNFATYLGEVTRTRENLIVAGSFGKSSLTALVAFLLRHAGHDPGWFIGAIPLDLPRTGHAGTDRLFVMEGDEYIVSLQDRRSKFELYQPQHILISSIVHDHINMFPTMAAYEAPFAKLFAALPTEGLMVACHSYEPVRRLIGNRPTIWYGLQQNPGYYAEAIDIGEITRFQLVCPDGQRIALETSLLGLHNIENLIGGSAFVLERGLLNPDQLQAAVRAFRGVARRLDKKTTSSRIPAYEGFGSSYEKARSAIEAIRLHFPHRPLVVVFEPHTFSWRNQDALAWYDSVFADCAAVHILPPPTIAAGSHQQLSLEDILAHVQARGILAQPIVDADAFASALPATLTGDEVVLLLSSGPLEGLADSLPAALDAHFGDHKPTGTPS